MATREKTRNNKRLAIDPSANARKVPAPTIDETGANIVSHDETPEVENVNEFKELTASQARSMVAHVKAIMDAHKLHLSTADAAIDKRIALGVAVTKAERALPPGYSFKAWCETVTARGWPGYETLRKVRKLGATYLDDGAEAARAELAHWRLKAAKATAKHEERKRGQTGDNSGKMTVAERAALRASEAVNRYKLPKKQEEVRAAILAEIAGDGHVIVTTEQANAMAASPAKASAIKDATSLFKAWKTLDAGQRNAAFGLIAAAMASVIDGTK